MTKLEDHKYQITLFEGTTYLIQFDIIQTFSKFIHEQDYDSAKCLLLISDRIINTKEHKFIQFKGDIYYE